MFVSKGFNKATFFNIPVANSTVVFSRTAGTYHQLSVLLG